MQGKLAKRPSNQPVAFREGEGVVVGIVRERSPGGVGIYLDFSDAPVPERRLSADAARVVAATDMVRILFAQFKAAGPELEHVVVVRLPFAGVRMFLESMKTVAQSARTYLSRINNAASPSVDYKSVTTQTFALDANMIVAGFSGREACMDFYYSSPQVKVALTRGNTEYRAEPVARVMLTTRLLMDIHDELASKLDTLPPDDAPEIEIEAKR